VEERRAQLVGLALELFGAHAYDELSVDDLARLGGVSKGLLYHYFPTKRDLYVAALRLAAERLLAQTAAPDALPPAARLAEGLDRYLTFVESHSRSFRALLQGGIGSDPEVAAVVEETRQAFADRLLQGLAPVAAGGAVELDAPLARVLVRAWVGAVEAASLAWLSTRDVARAEVQRLLVRALVALVAQP
jgi:AcrR family transcriptional regulator